VFALLRRTGRLSLVKFGLRVPSFPVDGSSAKTFVNQILGFLKELEENYSSAWVDDHFVPWLTSIPKATPNLESFTSISYLAGVFQKLTFGNIVLCNSYRNPATLAKMAATLQTLTHGRFVLGIGAGWKEDEYIAYGYEFPSPRARVGQLEEGVQIIRRMWTEETVTFKGRYYTVDQAYCEPKPKPVPPVMIGGGGEKLTLRVVARYADWWNLPNVSPETYQHKLAVLKEHCRREGRDSAEIAKTLGSNVAIAETDKEARRLAVDSPFINMENEESFVIGDPARVSEKLREYIRLGVELFILRFVDFPKTGGAKLFAEKVIPAFT